MQDNDHTVKFVTQKEITTFSNFWQIKIWFATEDIVRKLFTSSVSLVADESLEDFRVNPNFEKLSDSDFNMAIVDM